MVDPLAGGIHESPLKALPGPKDAVGQVKEAGSADIGQAGQQDIAVAVQDIVEDAAAGAGVGGLVERAFLRHGQVGDPGVEAAVRGGGAVVEKAGGVVDLIGDGVVILIREGKDDIPALHAVEGSLGRAVEVRLQIGHGAVLAAEEQGAVGKQEGRADCIGAVAQIVIEGLGSAVGQIEDEAVLLGGNQGHPVAPVGAAAVVGGQGGGVGKAADHIPTVGLLETDYIGSAEAVKVGNALPGGGIVQVVAPESRIRVILLDADAAVFPLIAVRLIGIGPVQLENLLTVQGLDHHAGILQIGGVDIGGDGQDHLSLIGGDAAGGVGGKRNFLAVGQVNQMAARLIAGAGFCLPSPRLQGQQLAGDGRPPFIRPAPQQVSLGVVHLGDAGTVVLVGSQLPGDGETGGRVMDQVDLLGGRRPVNGLAAPQQGAAAVGVGGIQKVEEAVVHCGRRPLLDHLRGLRQRGKGGASGQSRGKGQAGQGSGIVFLHRSYLIVYLIRLPEFGSVAFNTVHPRV